MDINKLTREQCLIRIYNDVLLQQINAEINIEVLEERQLIEVTLSPNMIDQLTMNKENLKKIIISIKIIEKMIKKETEKKNLN